MSLVNAVEFKVGLLVLVVSGLVAFLTLGTNEDPSYLGRANSNWFLVEDASGIVKNSIVRSAGIRIGIIKEIRLENGRARIEVALDKEVHLTTSSRAELRNTGILGDKYVDIALGNPNDPQLASGEQIVNVESKGSMDAVMANVGKLANSLKEVADALKASVTGDGDINTPLGRIVHNLDVVTGDIRELTQGNKKDISQIVANIKEVSENLNTMINDESDEGFKTNFKKMSQSLAKVESILTNVDDITAKINRGEGSIGKLINDDKTVTGLNDAIEGVNDFLGSANRVQTSINLHTEVLTQPGLTKSYLGVRLQPGLDRYYEVQIVDDPRGVIERKSTTDTVSGASTTTDQSVTYKNRTKFTAIFAKNFYDFTIRGGLIENTGGIGAEYKTLKRKLIFGLDAFDFSAVPSPHLRGSVRYNLLYGFYFIGGADDFLNRTNYSSYVGAGLDLTNDDLAMLFSKVQ